MWKKDIKNVSDKGMKKEKVLQKYTFPEHKRTVVEAESTQEAEEKLQKILSKK